jgi:superoxide dismutase, Fe-Mn family
MSDQMERRDFIQRVGVLAGSAAVATLIEQPGFAQTGGAKPMTYEPKPLSLDLESIKGISEKVLLSHYENNYVGAVKRLNAIGTS